MTAQTPDATLAEPQSLAGKSVSLERLSKRYAGIRALDSLDLALPAGAFCTLLGPSGSGKTTVLKLVAGFETPSEGAVRIDGRDVAAVPASARNIGMVFQNYALFPHMSVAQNVAFGLEMRRLGRAEVARRVRDGLALVDLAGYDDRLPRQLSGGQQQRVALARALVIRPDILLMDEPLGALDKGLRQSLQVELKRLHARVGVTVLFVTHDQEEALHLSDLVAVLNHGRLQQVGPPEALYNRPENTFVAGFLGDCTLLPGTVACAGDRPVLRLADGTLLAAGRIAPGLTAGADAVLGVRPESVAVSPHVPAAADTVNRLPAQVDTAIFSGNSYRILLHAAGQTVSATLPNTRNRTVPPPGTPVHLTFTHTDAFILAA